MTTSQTPEINKNSHKKRKGVATSDIPAVIAPGARFEIVQTLQVGAAKLKRSDPDYDKKIRRLLRNRQVARECRNRKRQKMSGLEEENQRLRELATALQAKLTALTGEQPHPLLAQSAQLARKRHASAVADDTTEQPQQSESPLGSPRSSVSSPCSTTTPATPTSTPSPLVKKSTSAAAADITSLRALLSSGASDETVAQVLKVHTNKYADFGSERRSQLAFHLRRLRALLVPTQFSKMVMWALQQEDASFYTDRTDRNSIWALICDACQFTPEQQCLLTDPSVRQTLRQQSEETAAAMQTLNSLEANVHANVTHLDNQMQRLQGIASPTQQARFLLWLEDNQACMHMLDNMWHNSSVRHQQQQQQEQQRRARSRAPGAVSMPLEQHHHRHQQQQGYATSMSSSLSYQQPMQYMSVPTNNTNLRSHTFNHNNYPPVEADVGWSMPLDLHVPTSAASPSVSGSSGASSGGCDDGPSPVSAADLNMNMDDDSFALFFSAKDEPDIW